MRDPANDALRDVGAARDDVARAERELERAVLAARRAGATWQEIGDTLAVTRQAAFKRFGKPSTPRPARRPAPDRSSTPPHSSTTSCGTSRTATTSPCVSS